MNIFDNQDPKAAVKPEFYPIEPEEINDICSRFTIRPELRAIWSSYGYGFFNTHSSGERATDFLNRLLAPSQIADVKDEIRIGEPDPFLYGTPFFEIADLNYLVLTPEGSVVEISGNELIPISPDLENFFRSLMDDPEFYIASADGSQPDGKPSAK